MMQVMQDSVPFFKPINVWICRDVEGVRAVINIAQSACWKLQNSFKASTWAEVRRRLQSSVRYMAKGGDLGKLNHGLLPDDNCVEDDQRELLTGRTTSLTTFIDLSIYSYIGALIRH